MCFFSFSLFSVLEVQFNRGAGLVSLSSTIDKKYFTSR